jgi:hypothetical protein
LNRPLIDGRQAAGGPGTEEGWATDVILGASGIAKLEFNPRWMALNGSMSSLATNIKHFKQRLKDKERDLLAEITRLEGEGQVSGGAEDI